MISATMWDLLTGLKDLFETETNPGGDLSQIQQVKRGMLAPRSAFPVITMIPVSESYLKLSSGRRATLEKSIEVMLYWRDLRGASAISDMQSYMDTIISLIEGARQLPKSSVPQAMSAEIGAVDFSDIDVNQKIYAVGSVTVGYINKEDLPNPTVTTANTDDPGMREVASKIYDNLYADSDITAATTVYPDPFGPFNHNRAIVVIEPGTEMSSPKFAGADELQMTVDVNVMSPVQRSADKELQAHLTIIENVKTRLWTDINLGGLTTGRVSHVDHGSTQADSRTLYISQVGVGVQAMASVTPV
jgi:hypothetical protein